MPQKQPRKAAPAKPAGRGKRGGGAGGVKNEPAGDGLGGMDDDVDCEVLEESPKIELENGSVLYISNIMATVNLGCALHLRTVAQHIQNCEFNMGSRKNTCMMRMRNPPVTAEIFNNGKVRQHALHHISPPLPAYPCASDLHAHRAV
jgi:hypothetical protein